MKSCSSIPHFQCVFKNCFQQAVRCRLFSYAGIRILPSSMRMIRSDICAISGLWVIITMVWRNSLLVIFSRPITSSLVLLSRLPVGSSARTMEGLDASARAMATLCCCPPDRLFGRLVQLAFQSQHFDHLHDKLLIRLLSVHGNGEHNVLPYGQNRNQVLVLRK